MVTNVTSLLKTVKAVEDEHTRGTRALESTIEAIGQEIRVSSSIIRFFLYFSQLVLNGRPLTLRKCLAQKPLRKTWYELPSPLLWPLPRLLQRVTADARTML